MNADDWCDMIDDQKEVIVLKAKLADERERARELVDGVRYLLAAYHRDDIGVTEKNVIALTHMLAKYEEST